MPISIQIRDAELIPGIDQDHYDQLCCNFDKELRRGASPSIREFLERLPSAAESKELVCKALFLHLLQTELQALCKNSINQFGYLPSRNVFEEYRRKYPEFEPCVLYAFAEIIPLIDSRQSDAKRYSKFRLIDQGGLGRVWKAHDNELRRDVAIKIPYFNNLLQNDGTIDTKKREQIEMEAERQAGPNHPNIVTIYERGRTEQGSIFIVMEYMEKGDLEIYAKTHDIDDNRAAEIVATLASTLARIHKYESNKDDNKKNMIHGDIKPKNILFDACDNVKLGDFGLATTEKERVLNSDKLSGTILWMAPEMVTGKPMPDKRSDIFCLGLIFAWLLLKGKLGYEGLPFHEPEDPHTKKGLKNYVERRSYQSIGDFDEKISKDFVDIVKTCLMISPDNRFENAEELVKAIEDALDRLNGNGRVNTSQSNQVSLHSAQEIEDKLVDYCENQILAPLCNSPAADLPETKKMKSEPDRPSKLSVPSELRIPHAVETIDYSKKPFPKTKSRRPIKLAKSKPVILSTITALFLIGATFIVTRPRYGDLEIKYDGEKNIEISVKYSDDRIETFEVRKDKKNVFHIRAGEYKISIKGAKPDEYKITSDKIELVRGGKTTVSIRYRGARPINDTETKKNKNWVEKLGGKIAFNEFHHVIKVELSGIRIDGRIIQRLSDFPHLTSLSLDKTRKTNEILKFIPLSVTTLSLHNTSLDDDGCRELAKRPLIHLGMQDTEVGNPGIEALANCFTLVSINLQSTKITSECADDLIRLEKLSSLVLNYTEFGDAGIKKLALKLKHKMKVLHLAGCPITDESLKEIGKMSQVRELGLNFCKKFTDKGVLHLKNLSRLESLGLYDCPISAEVIAELNSLPDLKTLHLGKRSAKDMAIIKAAFHSRVSIQHEK